MVPSGKALLANGQEADLGYCAVRGIMEIAKTFLLLLLPSGLGFRRAQAVACVWELKRAPLNFSACKGFEELS